MQTFENLLLKNYSTELYMHIDNPWVCGSKFFVMQFLVTVDYGGSMMRAIMLFFTEKCHLDLEPFLFI